MQQQRAWWQNIGLQISLGVHGILIILALVELPFLSKPEPITSGAISVQLAASLPQVQPAPTAPKPPAQQAKPAAPPPKPETPPPPRVENIAPPPKEVAKPAPVVAAKPELKPAPKPKPEVKPEVTPKVEPAKPAKPQQAEPKPAKPVQQAQPKPQPKEEPAKQESVDDFASSILSSIEPVKQQAAATSANPAAEGDLSASLNPSEYSALQQQLARCWNFPAGAPNPEELVVRVKVTMNRDRSVRSASIVREPAKAGSPYYQIASESALRALYHPQCMPLQLPPAKFDMWQQFTVRFDPRAMVGIN